MSARLPKQGAAAADGSTVVDRALRLIEVLAPEPSAAIACGRQRLASLLERVARTSWPEVLDWFSPLTPEGIPVEIVWSPGRPGLRYTVEAGAPEIREADRLRQALALLAELGQPLPEDLAGRLVQAQADRELRFGAWLGGRHDAGGERFKLYAELPADADIKALGQAAAFLPLLAAVSCRVAPRMLGVEPVAGRTELYLRLGSRDATDLVGLFSALGICPLTAGLDTTVRHLTGAASWHKRLSGRRIGLSLAMAGSGPPQLGLFVPLRSVLGDEASIRAHLARAGGDPAYRRLAAAADLGRIGYRHVMLSLAIAPGGGPAAFAVGLQP